MDDDSNNWNEVKPSEDGKRNHSSSPEQNTLRTPVKKSKKPIDYNLFTYDFYLCNYSDIIKCLCSTNWVEIFLNLNIN
jgi:hypothetical protein